MISTGARRILPTKRSQPRIESDTTKATAPTTPAGRVVPTISTAITMITAK